MTIKEVVDKALEKGCLTPQLEAALLQAIEYSFTIDELDVLSLERLQKSVLSGEIVTLERKRCFNVMEEIVWEVLEQEYSVLATGGAPVPDAGDVAAYALNHLKPLYATSEEGAKYQREKVRAEQMDLVKKRVREALEHSLGRPIWHPDRKQLGKRFDRDGLDRYLSSVLKGVPSMM